MLEIQVRLLIVLNTPLMLLLFFFPAKTFEIALDTTNSCVNFYNGTVLLKTLVLGFLCI
jgi:hypothetical protein